VSPSKKANKPSSKAVSAQKRKNPARSSRASKPQKKVTAEKTLRGAEPGSGSERSAHNANLAPAPAAISAEMTGSAPLPSSSEKSKASWSAALLRVLALLAVVAITAYIYSIRSHVAEFERFGYVGIFLIALMANATVLLPAPGIAIIYAMGGIFNPLWVGLAAGTGGALGELSGYLAGFSGQAIVEKTSIYHRIHPWVEKYGGWTVFALSVIPNPFFDVAGIAAGMTKLPLRTFLLFTWAGQIIKMLFFAMAGYYSLEWLTNFMQ
jgi:membrane protein DedA with SNARE-associated domain